MKILAFIGALLWCVSAFAQAGQNLTPSLTEHVGSSAPTPTVVQDAAASAGSGCTTNLSGCTITLSATAAGNTLAPYILDFMNGGSNAFTFSDGVDTCSTATGANSQNYNATNVFAQYYVCPNIAGGTTSITVTSANTTAFVWGVQEIHGTPTSSVYEVGFGNNTTSSGSLTMSGIGPTTAPNELILMTCHGDSGAFTFTSPTSPWVSPTVMGGSNHQSFYQDLATATTFGFTATENSATTQSCAGLVFKHP